MEIDSLSALEKEFNAQLMATYVEAKRSCRYNATYLLQMLTEIGGIETAKRLLASENPAAGLTTYNYLADTMFFIPTTATWLLGLLNSKLIFWFYTKISSQIRGGFVRFKSQYVGQIPIPNIESHIEIENYVEQIQLAKKDDSNADVLELERQIDFLVYQLYGLTNTEIAVVEAPVGK